MNSAVTDLIRRWGYQAMRSTPANAVFKPILKTLASAGLYNRGRFIYPVKGKLNLQGSDLQFQMETDGSDLIAGLCYFWGVEEFERETFFEFKKLAHESKTFLDIGAHTGFYSLVAAALNKDIKAFAFEPVPSIFQVLKQNVECNGFRNIEVIQECVGDKISTVEFYLPKSIRLASGGSTNSSFRGNTELIRVAQTTIDEFVQKSGIRKLDLIKIDTESTEALVLRGGLNVIRRDRPFIFCEILQVEHAKEIFEIMRPLNYEFLHLTPEGPVRLEDHENFIPSSHFNFLIRPRSH